MADKLAITTFQNTILSALAKSKYQLVRNGLDCFSTRDAIEELKTLTVLVSNKHFGNYRYRYKNVVVTGGGIPNAYKDCFTMVQVVFAENEGKMRSESFMESDL